MGEFYVSQASLRNLKARIARDLPTIPSSHLSEALAAALGQPAHARRAEAAAGKRPDGGGRYAFHRAVRSPSAGTRAWHCIAPVARYARIARWSG